MIDRNSDNSENAGFGNKNPTSESSVGIERQPMPDRTPDANSDKPHVPPARSGSAAEAREKPTEADTVDNPVRHTGHIPPPVTSNRD